MPTYDYKCLDCEAIFEAFHGMNEAPELKCEKCSSANTQKMIGMGAGVHFKGSGFYVTDYKKPGASTTSTKNAKSATKSETKSTTTPTSGHNCGAGCSH